ncbi:MAG: FkbM family methyltransferase [Methylococcaceae bacterium]
MKTPNKNLKDNHTEELLQQILQQMTALNNYQRYLALGPDKICQFMYADRLFNVYLPFSNKDLIQKQILMNNTFFELHYLRTIQPLIPANAVIIDAGANIGNHTLFFAGVCRARKVYSFEPLKEIFKILEKNISINGFDQVMPINAVLGANPGYASLDSFIPNNIGATSFALGTEGNYEITTIDALNLDKVDFIKMDVEGAQQSALEGAKQTLTRCRPRLWIELRQKFGEYEPTANQLSSMGYRLERKLGSNDFLFVASVE